MFKGEKTILFWVGLGILGFASTFILFNSVWSVINTGLRGWNVFSSLQHQVPAFVEGVVFSLIGFYMMKSGVKRKEE